VTAAVFGLLGVLVGGVLQFLAQEVAARRARRVDAARIRLLKKMLDDRAYPWRRLGTCARVIGADEGTTVRLLIEAGARASEKEGEEDLWGLVSRHPFAKRA
jgi:macrodomain Ter protein organizer (MatP/YcbG family)